MIDTFNTDNPTDVALLMNKRGPFKDQVEPRPYELSFGSNAALQAGFSPLEDAAPNILLPRDEWVDRYKEAHDPDVRSLPEYHIKRTWRPGQFRYNQNGLGYCWTWSGTGCLMSCRAMEDKDTVLLSPVSMGYLVNWSNRGNYLASFVRGARGLDDRMPGMGIAPVPEGTNINSTNRNASFWANYNTQRKLYLLDAIWDLDPQDMVRQCVSCLYYGSSIYVAYSWWGHAVELVSIRFNPNTGQMEWVISNSHNEDDFIIMTGSRAEPDEGIVFVSSRLAA